jgi:hypothetical protein
MSRCTGSLALFVVLLVPLLAQAHGRSTSYSRWEIDAEGASVWASVSRLDLTRLGLDPIGSALDAQRVGALLAADLALDSGGAPCSVRQPVLPVPAAAGWVAYRWRLLCEPGDSRVLRAQLLQRQLPSHLHFARVQLPDGRVLERVLTGSERRFELAARLIPPPLQEWSLLRYLRLGTLHILSGWDHLAFVLALLLLARSLREVAVWVTGFTAAHSLTLALAVLGVVQPTAHVVEALIGFSIALVAAENSWILGRRGYSIPALCALAPLALAASGATSLPTLALVGLALFSACHFALLRRSGRPALLRGAVAFAFGLVHGFGFAGTLAELQLPSALLLPALLGFNFGVELGQLAAIALTWPLLRVLGSVAGGAAWRPLTEIGSAAVCGLGLFWFVSRSFA